MKKKTLILIAGSIGIFAIALSALQPSAGQAKQDIAPEPNPAIIAKLQEVVKIREMIFQSYELLFQSGRAPADGLAEIELAETRLQLARERNQKGAIVAELKNLVAAHERRVKRVQATLHDRGAPADADRVRVGLLEAEIRLLKEQ